MNPQSAQPMLWQADVLVRWRHREQVTESHRINPDLLKTDPHTEKQTGGPAVFRGGVVLLGRPGPLHCESRHQFFGLSGVTCMKPGTPKPPCCGGGFVVIVINQIPVPRTIGHLALFVAGGRTVVVKSVAVSGSM